VSTNVTALTDRRQNNLKRLEEDLNRPLRAFDGSPGAGGDLGPIRPPAGPMIQSKTVRELLDRQKNWAFETPEDQLKGPSDDERSEASPFREDGKASSRKSAAERYYEALSARDAASPDRVSEAERGSRDWEARLREEQDADDPARNAVRSGLGQSEQGLRQIAGPENDTRTLSGLGDAPVMPDLFDTKGVNSWQARAQESRLDQFRQSLQVELPRSVAPSVSGPSPGGIFLRGSLPGGGGYGSSGFNFAPPANPAVTAPGASGFSSAGLSAAPSLSPVSPPAYTPPAPAKKPPSMFTEMPRPRF
jgi:hypothetical protein